MEKEKKKSKVIISIIVGLILILGIGFTIAYFSASSTSDPRTITSGNLSIMYENESTFNLTDLVPLYEDRIESDAAQISFSVRNTGNLNGYASIGLTDIVISDNLKNEDFKYALYDSDTNEKILQGNLSNVSEKFTFINNIEFNPGDVKNYKVYIWINETDQDQNALMNGSFKAKVTVNGSQNILASSSIILNNNTLNEEIPDFSKGTMSKEDFEAYPSDSFTTDKGLYKDIDDDGDTYYFRGVVENNYVKFANYYWRIIRINGDGTIRMIYDGTIAHENGEVSEDRYIGTSVFNTLSNSEEYLGYTYPTRTGYKLGDKSEVFEQAFVADNSYYFADTISIDNETGNYTLIDPVLHTASECYEDKSLCEGKYTTRSSTVITRAYIYEVKSVLSDTKMELYAYENMGKPVFESGTSNDSTIKQYIDSWYETNMKEYDDYIATTRFCNDTSYEIYKLNGRKNYGTYTRTVPSFKCPETNAEYGGSYNLKIGLITGDELQFAGGITSCSHLNHYLEMGYDFYTLSPYYVNLGKGYSTIVNGAGCKTNSLISNEKSVRPVINLNTDTIFANGDGTKDNPYMIKES